MYLTAALFKIIQPGKKIISHTQSLRNLSIIRNCSITKREKNQITYKSKFIKITDFSTETLKARRAWSKVF
jgi:hypothetical protein